LVKGFKRARRLSPWIPLSEGICYKDSVLKDAKERLRLDEERKRISQQGEEEG